MMTNKQGASERNGLLIGMGGLALAACCLVAPLLFGVAIGAALGGALDIAAAVMVAAGTAIVLNRRRVAKGKQCCGDLE